MATIIDQDFMNMINKIPMNISLTLKNNQLGAKRSLSKGSSVEFSDYREYIPGDDFRRIDWNALARFEKVYIKLFMEEQEAPVTIFQDISKSMDFDDKRQSAIKCGATFLYTALANYDSVNAVFFSNGIKSQIVSQRGKRAFYPCVERMEKMVYEGESLLKKSVLSWQQRFRKGITVIVSDFMYDHELRDVLAFLHFKKQKVILCHILSDNELHPVLDENYCFLDSESRASINIDAGSEALELYQSTFNNYIDDIKDLCQKYHAQYFMIPNEASIEAFVRSLSTLS